MERSIHYLQRFKLIIDWFSFSTFRKINTHTDVSWCLMPLSTVFCLGHRMSTSFSLDSSSQQGLLLSLCFSSPALWAISSVPLRASVSSKTHFPSAFMTLSQFAFSPKHGICLMFTPDPPGCPMLPNAHVPTCNCVHCCCGMVPASVGHYTLVKCVNGDRFHLFIRTCIFWVFN